MSLNGLDVPAIQDAYQAAITEAGGWFLVKYVSRDSVELLARGKNGVHEARNAIAKYEEQSPLYGLIIYRRRKILIKFIPEGTSRLLQARTAVHFQDVLERYSPHETLLEISHADGLNDTSLASSFPLHTASPSASSSRLHEISEDGEDPGSMPRPARTQSSTGSIFGTRQYKLERRVDQLMRSERPRPLSRNSSSESAPTMSSSLSGAGKPSISQQFLVRDDSGKRSITSLTSPSTTSLTEYAGSSAGSDTSTAKDTETIPSATELPKVVEQPSNESPATHASEPADSSQTPSIADPPAQQTDEPLQRLSSLTSDRSVERPNVSERPSISERSKASYDEPFDFSYLEPKPKVKLGPRPVAAPERTKRPLAAGISALPAAYRPAARKQEQESRRKSQQGSLSPPLQPQSPPATIYTPPPIPESLDYKPRPLSCKSLPSQKSTGMTSDKIRLMKAVELRKKKLRKSNPQVQPPVVDNDAPEVPNLPGAVGALTVDSAKVHESSRLHGNVLDSANKADSGIEWGPEREAESAQNQSDDPRAAFESAKMPEADEPQDVPNMESAIQEPDQTIPEPSNPPQLQPDDLKSDAPEPPMVDHVPEPVFKKSRPQRPRSISSGLSTMAETQDVPTYSVQKSEVRQVNQEPREDQPDANPDAQGSAISTSLEHLITDMPTTLKAAVSQPPASPAKTSVVAPSFETEHRDSPAPMDSNGRNSFVEEHPVHDNGDLAKRRRGLVEPLHINVEKAGISDGEIGSDDELMEELQTATLHEAKPMAMAKSPGPGAQFFPGRTSNQSAVSTPSSESLLKQINIVNGVSHTASDNSRDQSQQRSERGPSQSPEPTTQPRTLSATNATSSHERSEGLLGLRGNVSNGITQRIQALAEHSSRETSPTAVRIPNRSPTPEAAPNMNIVERRPIAMRSPRSRTSSYRGRRQAVERMGSTTSSVNSPFESAPIWTVSQDGPNNRSSVSVKARIVRPSTAGSEQQAVEGATPSPTALLESRLEISHMRGTPTPTSVSQAFLPPLPPSESNSALNSPALPRESTETRTLHSAKRKSWGRKQATQPIATPEEFPVPSLPSRPESGSASRASVDEPNPAGNRTSRFFKRMSNIGNMTKRRSNAQSISSMSNPTTTELSPSRNGSTVAGAGGVSERDRSDMPPAVVVGDLNVQFPDTLLWKRRSLSLTSTGHLCLSISNAPESQRPGRQFALTDFKAPFVPDADRMELPFSVWLEFASGDGGVLQVACEDGMGQRQVLRLLSGYWKSWVG